MSDSDSFAKLLSGLRAGDDEAATDLVGRFSDRLLSLARSRLDQRLKGRVDPEDVLQSVFGSFLRRVKQGEFQLENWNDLWALQVEITLRKCYRQWRRHQAGIRDVRQESPRDGKVAAQDNSWELVSLEPTPAQAAMLEETQANLISMYEGRQRKMLELALQGQSAVEISGQVERSEWAVRRFLGLVRNKLERMAADEE